MTGLPSAKPSALATLAPTSSAPARPGPLRVGDPIEIVEPATGFGDHAFGQRHDAPDVVARRELGHHAAVGLVHRDLRVQRVREQAPRAVVDGEPGFVAGGFDAQDHHGARIARGKHSKV